MSVEESRFQQLADALLTELLDRIDSAIGEECDVDLQGGVMTIDLPDGRQFILNKHAPMRQVWLSSPLSGAWHFDCDEATGGWQSTRDASVLLLPLLARELSQAAGQKVVL